MTAIDYIINKVFLPDFIGRFTELKQHNTDEWRGVCPIHDGAENNMSISVRSNRYYCHSCHSGGSVINFVADMEHITYDEAIERVCEEFNIDISSNEQYKKQKSIVEKFTQIAERYQKDVDSVKDYLSTERGFSLDTINAYGFGYNGEMGVTIPLRDPTSRIVGITIRNLNKKPKYQNSKNNEMFDKSAFLYNLDRARRKIDNSLLLVEGYFDAVAADQMGIPCVAYLGSEITRDQILTLKKTVPIANLTIILCADNDDAGQKSITKARERFAAVAPQWTIKSMSLPEGCKDMNDVLVHGLKATDCVVESIDIYVLKQKLAQFKDQDSQYTMVGDYIRTVSNPMTKVDIAKYLAELWGKDKDYILEWFKVADDNRIDSILTEFMSPADCLDAYEKVIESGEITTGFPSIDESLGGARRGDVFFIGGYSGTKKTFIACELALHAIIRQKLRTLFFSMEMSAGSLTERMYANVCGISTRQLQEETKAGKHLEQRSIFEQKLAKYFYCIDKPRLTLDDINKRIKIGNSMVFDAPVDIVIIDYLQYISYTGEGFTAWSKMVQELKAVAKENNVLLIVLSQLNREGSNWEKPNIKFLKGGGDIEATGDIIILLWNESENPKLLMQQRAEKENQISLTIAKDRRGASNRESVLYFNPDTTRIREVLT